MARKMKNSGLPWVGKIPSDWEIKRLKYAADYFYKGNGITKDEVFEDGDISCIRYGEIYSKYNGAFVNCISKTKLMVQESPRHIKKGDILFACTGELVEEIGKNIVYMGNNPCLVGGDIIVMRHQKDPIFMNYALNSYAQTQKSEGKAKLKVVHISSKDIQNLMVLLPTLPEQKTIADFLDKKCAEIDGLLADLEAEVKTLAEYKKSIIAETVTRGLNPNAPMKQSGIPWVGDMPSHWKVIANKYIMHKKKDIAPIYEGQDIISLSMNGVIVRDLGAGGKMPTTFNGYQHIYPGNLLMCLFDIDVTPRCIGLIKNDGLTSPAYSQFVMEREAYAPYYYYFYLKMDNDKELVHLSKNMRHSLNEEQFGMIKTIFPPREEQEAIATYLDEKCAMIDQSTADKLTQIETLKSYKSSLIYEYVTGKKQVI